MDVSFSLSQSMNMTLLDNLFKVGNITIDVVAGDTGLLTTGYHDNSSGSGSGSGSGHSDPMGSIKYRYRFFFGNESSTVYYSNISNFSLVHYFMEEPVQLVQVEVIENDTTTGAIPHLQYGRYTKNISVLGRTPVKCDNGY